MIKINLLSPADKTSVKWKRIENLIITNSITIIAVLFVFIVSLGISYQYLNIENSNAKARFDSVEKEKETLEIKNMENGMKQYNNQLEFINKIREEHIYWTKLLSDFDEIVPGGVKIKNLDAKDHIVESAGKSGKDQKSMKENSDRFAISIAGNARTRDDLLKLEDNLKNSIIFFDLTAKGFYNYEEKVDIDFSYTFFVKKKDLMKE